MNNKKILFICGSLNQTTMMHKISRHLGENELYFTPYYSDGIIKKLANAGYLDFCILGGQFKQNTINYLQKHNLQIDCEGKNNNYDLVFTCTDLLVQNNIKNKKLILVQEGMTDADTILYNLVRSFKLPRYIAGTSATGQSNLYDYFCVASKGYKDFFISRGLEPSKVVVTGIPNFDNCQEYIYNDFPYKNYVLAATSDTRETFRFENRKKFINKCLDIADGRQLIFKLHPNENVKRAVSEINKYAPEAIVFESGNTNHMIADCDVLITKYSSVVYVGLALNKEVYSDFDLDDLKRMVPLQNNGNSAKNIADKARELLREKKANIYVINKLFKSKRFKDIKNKILKVA
jgi:hypothetical protein